MDEIDNIIIHSLKQIGCILDDDITSLSKFSSELLVETISKCLYLIKPTSNLPKTLPTSMAQRFSVTTALAEACTAIGFRGDIGYQTFLYSNIIEVRRVFMFLIEKLPKDNLEYDSNNEKKLDKVTTIELLIINNIKKQLKTKSIVKFHNNKITDYNNYNYGPKIILFKPEKLYVPCTSIEDDDKKNYWIKYSPSLFERVPKESLISTIIATNSLYKYNYKFLTNCNTIKLNNNKTNSLVKDDKKLFLTNNNEIIIIKKSDEILLQESNEIKFDVKTIELEKNINEMKGLILTNINNKKSLDIQIKDVNKELDDNINIIKELKSKKLIKERTIYLLNNEPNENIKKLKQLIQNINERMNKLVKQWDEHRLPLINSLNNTNSIYSKKTNEINIINKKLNIIKEKIQYVNSDINMKNNLYKTLLIDYENMNKNIVRDSYTKRIFEIINNIRKQKNDIDNILKDARKLQKDINLLTGQLDRQFTVTDDLIFKTAKRDEYSRKSYKLLATLHQDCSDIIKIIQDIGIIMRDTRDIEEQIDNEKVRNITNNLKHITNDLKQMEHDNKELVEQITLLEKSG